MAQARDVLREARGLLKEFPQDSRERSAVNLAGLQARAGDVSGALETANSVINPGIRADALGNIAWRLARAGDPAQALIVLEPAEEGQRKASWYSTIATILVNQGDFTGARRVSAMIRDQPDYQAQVLTLIARKQKKAGDTVAAEKTMSEAQALAEQEHIETPDAGASVEPEILVSIAEAQDAMGNHAAAMRTLERLRLLVVQSQPGSKDELLKLFARALANVGEARAAAETARQIPIIWEREFNLQVVATFLAQRGDVLQAREIAASIPSPGEQAFALGNVAEAQIVSGDLPGAQETIALISDPGTRTFTLARIALELAAKSNPAAGKLLQLAQEAAASQPGDTSPGFYSVLAQAQAKLGDIQGAQKIIAGMDARGSIAPRILAQEMAKAGNVPGALAMARSQAMSEIKFSLLLRVATGILEGVEAERKKPSTALE